MLSAAASAVGGVAWVAFAVQTQHEWLWLALLPGGLAGLGMYYGYRETSFGAGVAAGALALISLVVSRTIIVNALFQPGGSLGDLVVAGLLATGGLWTFAVFGLACLTAFLVAGFGLDFVNELLGH